MILPNADGPPPGPSAVLRDRFYLGAYTVKARVVELRAPDHAPGSVRVWTRVPPGTVAVLLFVTPRDAEALGADVP